MHTDIFLFVLIIIVKNFKTLANDKYMMILITILSNEILFLLKGNINY